MSHISAIQGLRGVAVAVVLLFHVAPKRWPLGLLGVDMFFLISGYLMCSIMSKPLASVEQFYFRRIRRIVPSYLFLIGLVLFGAACGFVSAIDYWHLLHETKKALKFTANFANPREDNYFHQGLGLYYFLRHLWSLSTELQFYVLVPLLCFGLGKVRLPFRVIICSTIGIVSFCSQILSYGDSAHMALHNRVWQFMAGFIAFYAQTMKREERNELKSSKTDSGIYSLMESNDKEAGNRALLERKASAMPSNASLISIALQNLLQIVVLISLLIDLNLSLSFLRVFILFLCGIIVVFPPTNYTILNIPPLIRLGDISYSVYLLHWPPIQWYFYDNETLEAPAMVASVLIGFAIISGWLMERVFVSIAKWTTSWRRLVVVLALCYFLIAVPYIYVHSNESGIHKINARTIVREEDREQLLYDIDRIWRGGTPMFSTKQLAIFNYQLAAVTHTMATCSNKNSSTIPTKYDIAKEITFGAAEPVSAIHGITHSCYETGNGTKNIVIIGNSHAQVIHFGVKNQFEGIYANLTVLSAAACPLINWDFEVNAQHAFHRQTCIWFRDKILEVLRQWEHPIDIIIVAQAYQYPYDAINRHMKVNIDPVSEYDVHHDKYFRRFQTLYTDLSKIAREAVFIPHIQYSPFKIAPVDLIVRKIIQKNTLAVFRQFRSEQKQSPPLNDRLKHVTCPKCIHMNWEDVWCSDVFNSCDTVDYDRKIGYFADGNHVNALGSLMYGQYIRRLYERNVTGT